MPKIFDHKPGKKPTHKRCPRFEDAVETYLENEDERKRALGFSAWLRANKMAPSAGNSGYNWYVAQKGKRVIQLKMYEDTWFILSRWEINDELLLREDLKEVIWENTSECTVCNKKCGYKAVNYNIFGREAKNVCRQYFLRIRNPDEKTMSLIKNFLTERAEIAEVKT